MRSLRMVVEVLAYSCWMVSSKEVGTGVVTGAQLKLADNYENDNGQKSIKPIGKTEGCRMKITREGRVNNGQHTRHR